MAICFKRWGLGYADVISPVVSRCSAVRGVSFVGVNQKMLRQRRVQLAQAVSSQPLTFGTIVGLVWLSLVGAGIVLHTTRVSVDGKALAHHLDPSSAQWFAPASYPQSQ